MHIQWAPRTESRYCGRRQGIPGIPENSRAPSSISSLENGGDMQTATGVDAPDLVQLTMLILQGELPQQSVTDLVTDLEGELLIHGTGYPKQLLMYSYSFALFLSLTKTCFSLHKAPPIVVLFPKL